MKLIYSFKRLLILGLVLAALCPLAAIAKPVIVLDAAHGGSDSGVKAGSEVEKEWNSKFAQALQRALISAGFEVVQIRQRDETLSLERRTGMINTSQAAAVLIIHADRDWTGSQKGPVIVVEPPTQGSETAEISRWGAVTPSQYRSSLKLARDIAMHLGISADLDSLSDSRGVIGETISPSGRIFCLPHQSLRYLTMPAVVLTPLFLTSTTDLKKFSQAENISDFAAKVAQGLSDFLQ